MTDLMENRKIRTFARVDVLVPDSLRILGDKEHPIEGEGCFRVILENKGDERIVWRTQNIEEIKAAEDLFKKLIKQGMVPYRVGVGGRASSESMAKFDPHAGEVIFLPMKAISGG